MSEQFIGYKIIHLHSIDSTNNYAAKLFKSGDISSGAVIMADEQTNGRGQRQKTWQSDAFTNLMVSIAGDLNEWKIKNLTSLNHIIALGVARFISKYMKEVEIKWPNDIMVEGKKIAGILIENQLSSAHRKTIIGCGININQARFDFPRATSFFLQTNQTYPPHQFIHEYIDAINLSLETYQKYGEEELFEQFNQLLWLKNKKHPFHYQGETHEGTILTTTMDGQLIVEFDKKRTIFANGEVKY